MLSFQDEEILKGEKRIRAWQSKFVGLQSRLNITMGDISEQFDDMLQQLDEMRIKVEELKVRGTDSFAKLRGEIIEINNRIEQDYLEIERKLFS